jgi:hypothetical protein
MGAGSLSVAGPHRPRAPHSCCTPVARPSSTRRARTGGPGAGPPSPGAGPPAPRPPPPAIPLRFPCTPPPPSAITTCCLQRRVAARIRLCRRRVPSESPSESEGRPGVLRRASAHVRVEHGLDQFGTSTGPGRIGWPDGSAAPSPTAHRRLRAARSAMHRRPPDRTGPTGRARAAGAAGRRPPSRSRRPHAPLGRGSRGWSEGGARHRSGQADVDVTK